jgi:mono/diheme cytochrome c family protein
MVREPEAAAGIGLFTISLAISGCEGKAPGPPAGLLASRDAQRAGGVIFAASRAICYRPNANGVGQRREGMSALPTNLTILPWSELANAGKTFLSIRNGVPQTAMPSWPAISDQQIWQLVAYITSLNKVR